MKNIFIVVVVLAFFASCQDSTGIKDFVAGSDSVAINFYKGDGSMDSVVKVLILRDSVQVSALVGFIDSKEVEQTKCGYDGSLHFFKKDMVLKDVDFRMNEKDCMQFSFMLNNKLYATRLSGKAKDFLSALAGRK